MSSKVEKLAVPPMSLGEGPHWCAESESLYLVDILTSKICRYHPKSEKIFSAKLDVSSVGFIIPVLGCKEQFLIGAGITLYIAKWDGHSTSVESLTPIHSINGEPSTNRINDGKCDPFGRLWFGTMKRYDIDKGREGSFYSFTKEKGSTKHLTEIGISNGIAWDLGKNRMYYIDSLQSSVDALDYNTDGTIGNRRVVFDMKKNKLPFLPDGMTIDTDGNLWVACFNGSRVIKIDPEAGRLLDEIKLPTPQITSVAWGGQHLNELYITSAGTIPGGRNLDSDLNAGGIFRVTGLNIRGFPMTDFKLE